MIKKKLLYSLVWMLLCGPALGAQIIRYIDPDATGANNGTSFTDAYVSMFAWEAAEGQNLTDGGGDFMTVNCRSLFGTNDSIDVTINGFTLNNAAGNYIEFIGTDSSADGKWDDSAYVYHFDDTAQFQMTISDDAIRFHNIQFQLDCTAANSRIGVYISGVGTGVFHFDSCLFKGVTTGTGGGHGLRINDSSATVFVYSCVFYDFDADAEFDGIVANSVSTISVYNSTFYNIAGSALVEATGSSFATNVTIGDTGTADFTGWDNIDYCCTESGDGTNSNGPLSLDWDNEFVDANNGDFTPVSGGNILVAALNDPGSGLFSNDIAGNPFETDNWSRNAYAGPTSSGVTTGFHIISKDFWRTFFLEGINGRWEMSPEHSSETYYILNPDMDKAA